MRSDNTTQNNAGDGTQNEGPSYWDHDCPWNTNGPLSASGSKTHEILFFDTSEITSGTKTCLKRFHFPPAPGFATWSTPHLLAATTWHRPASKNRLLTHIPSSWILIILYWSCINQEPIINQFGSWNCLDKIRRPAGVFCGCPFDTCLVLIFFLKRTSTHLFYIITS